MAYLLHLKKSVCADGSVSFEVDKAINDVALTYICKAWSQPYIKTLTSLHPRYIGLDNPVAAWFAAAGISDTIAETMEVASKTPDSKRKHFKSLALAPMEPNCGSTVNTAIANQGYPNTRRKKVMHHDVIVEKDEDGKDIKTLIPISSEELVDRLAQEEHMEHMEDASAAIDQYDEFLSKVDKDGNIVIPKAIKSKAPKPAPRVNKDELIDKLKKTNKSLLATNARLRTQVGGNQAGHGVAGDGKANMKELSDLKNAAEAKQIQQAEEIAILKSKLQIAETDLAMAKLRAEGDINRARAELQAEFNTKIMAMHMPASASKS